MRLAVVEERGVKTVEGSPHQELMSYVADVDRLIEICLSEKVGSVLLYAENLTHAFFDLSSGEAGAIVQKLWNYGIRLAIVCTPGHVRFSSRFGEMVAEEQRKSCFGVFETRGAAREWLGH